VLTKPGRLSAEELTLIRRHPVDGAEMILQSDQELDLAAVVAYEHHMMLDGCGYPTTHYGQGRPSTLASRLIHVCDVFDALRTKRPYREAWEAEVVFAYLLEHAGSDFDPGLVTPFIEMMRRSQLQISDLPEEPDAAAGVPALDSVAAAGASTGTRS
jgi:putative two-component system response regulator